MEHGEFMKRICSVAARDTSFDPLHWTPENPLWGHCAVVALMAQELFGGELVRVSLEHVPEYAFIKSHYWNRLPNGNEVDFTAEQFNEMPPLIDPEIRSRDQVLNSHMKERYVLFRTRFNAAQTPQ